MLGLAPADFGLLVLAGLNGSAVNAVAGGGTLFTFPAFLSAGVAPVIANASNAVAIWPGRVLAIAAYWRELKRQRERALWTGVIYLLGGSGGAWLLLRSGDKTFLLAVPGSFRRRRRCFCSTSRFPRASGSAAAANDPRRSSWLVW